MVNQDSDDYELMPSNELDDLRREVSTMKKGSLTEGEKARVLMESMDRLVVSINRLITILDDAQKDIIEEYQDSKPAEKLNQLLDQNEAIAKAIISMSETMGHNSSNSSSRNPIPAQSSYQDSQLMPQQMSQQKSQMMPQQMQQQMYPDMQQQMPQQMQQPMYSDMQQQMPQQMQQMYPDMQQMPRSSPQQMQQQVPQQNMQMNNMQGGNLKNILPISDAQYINPQRQQQMSQSMPYNPSMQMGPLSMGPMGPMDDFPPMDDIPPLDTPAPSAPKKKFLGIM